MYGDTRLIFSGNDNPDIELLLGNLIVVGAQSVKFRKYEVLMAYPTFSAPGIPALVMPTIFPYLSNSGPPLLPGWIGAEI